MLGEVRVLSVFVGEELILPMQFAVPPELDTPSLRLYRALVFDAVHDFCREAVAHRTRNWYARPVLRDLIAWVTGGPAAVPYATAMAVGFPNVDADAVASQLLKIVGLKQTGDHLTLTQRLVLPMARVKLTRRELVRRQRRTRVRVFAEGESDDHSQSHRGHGRPASEAVEPRHAAGRPAGRTRTPRTVVHRDAGEGREGAGADRVRYGVPPLGIVVARGGGHGQAEGTAWTGV